jgi:hypothetical protein
MGRFSVPISRHNIWYAAAIKAVAYTCWDTEDQEPGPCRCPSRVSGWESRVTVITVFIITTIILILI